MFNSIAKHQFLTLILLSMFVTACDNDSINLPPVANTVGISGVTALGSTITGLYTYVDSENDVQGVSIFKWLRDDVAIPGANTLSYIITQQDQGKTLKFEVTPVAKTGTPIGIAVQSEYVIVDKALGVNIAANPVSGTSPLTVGFSVNVVNNNAVFKSYDWDFTSDNVYDISDTLGAPKTYIYTGPPGTKFIATLKVSPQGQESIIATKTITITDTPSSIQASSASSNVTNRHVPLTTTLTVTAQDPQGIAQVSVDYNGDGLFETIQNTNNVLSGTWLFEHAYTKEGVYPITVRITDAFGVQTEIAHNDSINLPPVANTVGISGVTALGSTITGLYTYVDNDVQGVSIFKWLRDDVAIPGANTLSYIITQQDQGKTLKFEVTPVAKTGTLIGIAVQSEYVIVDKALGVNIVANPVSGTSPLTVRFGVNVVNNNVVFKSYDWDFTSDDTYDISDTFGAPKTYIYTGPPGTKFIATLKASPQDQDSIIATKTITITDTPSSIQASSNITNGHVPLTTTLTVTAQDPQGIAQVSVDYNGDGVFETIQNTNNVLSGTWLFEHVYTKEGVYPITVRVTDAFGVQTEIAHNAIKVSTNSSLDPVIQVSATPLSGQTPLTVDFSATAQIFDNSAVKKWTWDLDGDGIFETEGGSNMAEQQSHVYQKVDYYYPSVKLTTQNNKTVEASVRVETTSNSAPSLIIQNTNDTINADTNEVSSFSVTLPNQTNLELWIEDAGGNKVKTIQVEQTTNAGTYQFTWDGTNEQNNIVSEGDYYVVLGYTQFGVRKKIDLRGTTGGTLSYYSRTTSNPTQFKRLEKPLVIDYAVDDPAEVSFFWQVSFGTRVMTLMEHERLGRGQYSLYWNGEYPSGEKIPKTMGNLLPGIIRYALPDNVIFVKSMPRIEHYSLKSTIVYDPRRQPIEMSITLSKDCNVELVVSDMEKGIKVATRVYANLKNGEHTLTWNGKNNHQQYLAPGDYRIGLRSVDKHGNRSLFWYRTQRISY